MTNEVEFYKFRAMVVCKDTLRLDGDEVGDWVDLTQSWEVVQDTVYDIIRAHSRYVDTDDEEHVHLGEYVVIDYEGFDPLSIDQRISLDLAHDIAQVAINQPVVLDVMADVLNNETGLNGFTPICYEMLSLAKRYVETHYLRSYDSYNDYLRRQAEILSDTEIDAADWCPDDFNWDEYGFNLDTCLDHYYVINRGRRFLMFNG